MVTVSISAYDDGDVLEACLRSVRDTLPDATIQVVDGRYKTWPAANDNSRDETPDLAASYGAEYLPEGPFPRERDKHVRRVSLAPDGEPCLLLDADERLVWADMDALATETAYQPRIHNPIVYGNRVAYWPRLFDPSDVATINRWDAYQFDVPCERTDRITISHRHDLRDEDYRSDKLDRLDNEDRYEASYYNDRPEDYVELALDEDTAEENCPECGHDTIVRSMATPFGPGDDNRLSCVDTCVNGDCYTGFTERHIREFCYLPGEWERGFENDLERLREELIAAGCQFVRSTNLGPVERMRMPIGVWVEEKMTDEREPEVFA